MEIVFSIRLIVDRQMHYIYIILYNFYIIMFYMKIYMYVSNKNMKKVKNYVN